MEMSTLWRLSYGMYAIGAMDGDRPCGCIVNTCVQITSDPVTIALSMNKDNYTHTLIEKTGRFSVSILTEETDPLVITYLGFQSGRERDKYQKLSFQWQGDLPVADDNSAGWLTCRVLSSQDCGSHTVFFAQVENSANLSDAPPMTYAYYHKVVKGKAPKNAPTYQKD